MNRYNDTGVRYGRGDRSAALAARVYRTPSAAEAAPRNAGESGCPCAERAERGAETRQENVCCTSPGCGYEAGSRYGLRDMPVAMTYAPLQNYCGLYDLPRALARGTVFSSLDLPLNAAGEAAGGYRRG